MGGIIQTDDIFFTKYDVRVLRMSRERMKEVLSKLIHWDWSDGDNFKKCNFEHTDF